MYWINFPSGGIFIWWKFTNNVNITAFSIQFQHQNQSHQVFFSDQVVGTYKQLGDFYGTWADVEKDLEKIKAQTKVIPSTNEIRTKRFLNFNSDNRQILRSSDSFVRSRKAAGFEEEAIKLSSPTNTNVTITEVRVPGNVSGILIPNSNHIVVRVLASTTLDGEPLKQDLRFLSWKTVGQFGIQI